MEKMNMSSTHFKDFIEGYSIEVVPNSAAKIESFAEILPKKTRVYVAHLEKEDIASMVRTAKNLNDQGFTVMPHIPARIIKNKDTLSDWISRYQNEAGVTEALLLAGGSTKPAGDYDSSIQLIESGLFSDEELIKMIEGYQRDPEQSKKDRHHSKQPDPSKDGFTGIGNMSIDDIMKMNAKIKAKAAKKK